MRTPRQAINIAVVGLLCALPTVVYANGSDAAAFWLFSPVWVVGLSLLTWWVIAAGWVVKFFFVHHVLSVPSKKAVWFAMVANMASTLAGVLIIPLVGTIWMIFCLAANYGMNALVFIFLFWAGLCFYACLCNVWIESLIYRRIFKLKVDFKGSVFWWYMLANAASVGLAAASAVIAPNTSLIKPVVRLIF